MYIGAEKPGIKMPHDSRRAFPPDTSMPSCAGNKSGKPFKRIDDGAMRAIPEHLPDAARIILRNDLLYFCRQFHPAALFLRTYEIYALNVIIDGAGFAARRILPVTMIHKP